MSDSDSIGRLMSRVNISALQRSAFAFVAVRMPLWVKLLTKIWVPIQWVLRRGVTISLDGDRVDPVQSKADKTIRIATLLPGVEAEAVEDGVEGGGEVGAHDQVGGVGTHEGRCTLDGLEIDPLYARQAEHVGNGLDVPPNFAAEAAVQG